jgi:hypothetical protein
MVCGLLPHFDAKPWLPDFICKLVYCDIPSLELINLWSSSMIELEFRNVDFYGGRKHVLTRHVIVSRHFGWRT